MGLLLIFVDGLGIGPCHETNPMFVSGQSLFGVHAGRLDSGSITGLPDHWLGRSIDATLGVDGLPQSATGHRGVTTIF